MRTSSLLPSVLVCLGLFPALGAGLGACSRAASPAPAATPHGKALDGSEVDPFADHDAVATVLLFVWSECPVSNRYAPEVARICREFAPKGVRFELVYPVDTDTPDVVKAHQDTYAYPCEVLLDPDHELVAFTGATMTPEVAVYDHDRTLVYRGRIDDLNVDYGKARAKATTHDLEDVLTKLVAGESVAFTSNRPVGCFIPEPQ